MTKNDIYQILFIERQVMRDLHTMDISNDELCEIVLQRFMGTTEKPNTLEDAEAVDGVVHHYANVHYIVTDQGQLDAQLKKFKDGEEIKVFIVKAKEEEK